MTGNPLEAWPDFVKEATRRLQAGQKAYGDASFYRPPDELAREIEEELLDVAAWSFILWTRVRSIRETTRPTKSGTSATHTLGPRAPEEGDPR